MDTNFPDIPGYEIQSQLGEGGFAKVYLARQVSLRRDVALKIMDPTMAHDRDFCERFVREGQDTAVLSNHPDIVTVYDIGRTDDRYYIAMQYLPGPNLKDLLDADEPYQHPLHIIKRMAGALAYAHSKGFVHRDVKPANILFNESHEAVLSDFGIAKTLNRHTQLTAVGSVIGTASYMSPEQAKGLASIDGRSDIYSLGIVLFELLTRTLPYKASDPMSLMLKHVNDPVPQLPPTEQIYQPLIDKMMAKDPDERYKDGYEFLDDVEARFFQAQAQPTASAPASAKQPHNLKKYALYGSAAALALMVGGGFLMIEKPFAEPASRVSTNTPADNQQLPQQPTTTVQNAPATTPEPAPVPAPTADLNTADRERLDRLLNIAELHEAVGRITSPPGANAMEAYSLALELDPGNQVALSAMTRLQSR